MSARASFERGPPGFSTIISPNDTVLLYDLQQSRFLSENEGSLVLAEWDTSESAWDKAIAEVKYVYYTRSVLA